ncbi:LysR family transcriptional regulator [Novosphingobium sp. PhB165]|uniref:LysR family transcriptional regulator n=1 Tax=Novosphingobium sp. PhB165 TaxID=2485105 RepID=UPI0010DCD084|nr:LysR family transcriptional regulator [Novosphingobium sp. PhB165]TCM19391.1 LysR family transcriptional regulator [Novosphingobium sp. PhB165]
MDLTRLRHIVAVARNQSFSRAAEEEGITQPALSRSIAAFEQRHGVTLFDRGRGGVHATAAGLHVVEQAKRLLDAAGDLERSLKRYPLGEPGQVAIGLGPLMAGLFLPRIASSLLRTWPAIRIRTQVRVPDQLVAELLNDRIEMILGNDWNLGRVPGTEIERLGRIRVACMVRGGHPLTGKGAVTMADLEAYPVASAVDMPTGGMSGDAGSFICDNFHVLRETVLRSDCVWISSPTFLADDLREGRIVQLDVAGSPQAHGEICLIVRRGRTRSPAAVAVAEEVRALLDKADA